MIEQVSGSGSGRKGTKSVQLAKKNRRWLIIVGVVAALAVLAYFVA